MYAESYAGEACDDGINAVEKFGRVWQAVDDSYAVGVALKRKNQSSSVDGKLGCQDILTGGYPKRRVACVVASVESRIRLFGSAFATHCGECRDARANV